MNDERANDLAAGIGNRITLDGFQEAMDYPLSIEEVESMNELIHRFLQGNWATNTAFLYHGLAFVQQVNGGDEWLTLQERTNGSWAVLESISCERMIRKALLPFSNYLNSLTEQAMLREPLQEAVFE